MPNLLGAPGLVDGDVLEAAALARRDRAAQRPLILHDRRPARLAALRQHVARLAVGAKAAAAEEARVLGQEEVIRAVERPAAELAPDGELVLLLAAPELEAHVFGLLLEIAAQRALHRERAQHLFGLGLSHVASAV